MLVKKNVGIPELGGRDLQARSEKNRSMGIYGELHGQSVGHMLFLGLLGSLKWFGSQTNILLWFLLFGRVEKGKQSQLCQNVNSSNMVLTHRRLCPPRKTVKVRWETTFDCKSGLDRVKRC